MGGDEDIRFTTKELKEIRKVSLARILCDNTKDVTKMQPQAFMTSDSDNKEVSCDDTSKIPKLDITPFLGVVERIFHCTDLNGRLAEKWTLTRNFADNTCTHKIEHFLAGRRVFERVLTGQECDFEPPCVREAKEIGMLNNGNSGKNKGLKLHKKSSNHKLIYYRLHMYLPRYEWIYALSFISDRKAHPVLGLCNFWSLGKRHSSKI